MKKVMYFSILCLLFVTISYTYSAFSNKIVGNIVGTSNNWVFKANVPTGIKENDYFKTPISGTSGSFNVAIDTTGSTKKAEYSIELDRNGLPDDLKFYTDSTYSNLISNDTYKGNSNNSTNTITIYYKSTTSLNGNIHVRVKGNVCESKYTMMKNGTLLGSGNTEFWSDTYRPYIKTITFTSDMSNKPATCTGVNLCWDISYEKNQSTPVYAYMIDSGNKDSSNNVLYNLYIASSKKIYAPIDSKTLFYNFINVESFNFNDYFDTSVVESMKFMFQKCNALQTIDISKFNTSKVTDMSYMFSKMANITSLDLKTFDTNNVTNMNGMFWDSTNLANVDLSSFNTSNVTDMGSLFSNCKKLKSLDLKNFNTLKVTNMWQMFANCSSLTSLDLSSFSTPNLTEMRDMFTSCSALTNLNLKNFGTANVTSMERVFYGCKALTSLDLSSFNTANVTNMSCMFYECKALTSLDLSNFNTSKVVKMGASSDNWAEGMFYECSSLTSLNISSFDTSSVEGMGFMFYGCSKLTTLNLNNFNTAKVINMQDMFGYCSSLTTLNISNFNTSKVTNMDSMFVSCSSLTSLNLSSFNTPNVTNMSSMFMNCSSLTTLNLSNFDTSKVTSMRMMFYMCSKLTSLTLTSFSTGNVYNMVSMFNECSSLTSLNLSSFDTSKVTNMRDMFYKCSSLTSLDLSSFNTSNVTNMRDMFALCSSLTSLDLSSFNTPKVTNMSDMFAACYALVNLNIGNFNTANVTNMSDMFASCFAVITTINIHNSNCESYSRMFVSSGLSGHSGKITINYVSSASSLVDQMIATKSYNSNIVKGRVITEYSVTVSGNSNITYSKPSGAKGTIITLKSLNNDYVVTSFKMNGTTITGNEFLMPASNVTITGIVAKNGSIFETEHYKEVAAQTNTLIGEKTFAGAKSLTITLDYQTSEEYSHYFNVFDSSTSTTPINSKNYGGPNRRQETITISGDYVKITMTASYNIPYDEYYGLKATIIANY